MTTLDDKTIVWTRKVSANGKAFEVGFQKIDGAAPPALPAVRTASADEVKVDWKTGTSGNPSQTIQDKTGIVWYSLHDNRPSYYDWRLDITTTRKFDYYFVDESGDKYRINAFASGNHYVRYNSDKPNIVKIVLY